MVDPHLTRLGHGLDPSRGVDRVAGDHPLPGRTDGDGHLAGHHPDAHGEAGHADVGAEGGYGFDQLQARPDRALRVVLVRDGHAPDRHHRVADELLDRAAVALDDQAGFLEVAGEQLSDLLGVAALGQGGEPDEVTEDDGGEPSLGHRERGFGPGVGRLDRGPALGAEPAALGGRPAGRALPSTLARRRSRGRTSHQAVRRLRTAHRPRAHATWTMIIWSGQPSRKVAWGSGDVAARGSEDEQTSSAASGVLPRGGRSCRSCARGFPARRTSSCRRRGPRGWRRSTA